MKDSKVVKKELLVNSFKKVVKETLLEPDGTEIEWIYQDTPKSVMIIAITSDNNLILINQYRYNLKEYTLELPAGGLDKQDSDELAAAKRELKEETGYTSENIINLGKYYVMPSETNRWIYFFLALDCVQSEEPKLDTDIEKYFDMSIELVNFNELLEANTEKITGIETLFGLQLAKSHINKDVI